MVPYANILLLGTTGAGKSSFINYLLGSDVCRTGRGMPVTEGFETHELAEPGKLPLRLFDSKGLEVLEYDRIREDILSFLRDKSGGEEIADWMHSVFYCINAESGRLLPAEIDLIRSIQEEISQSVHLVLTHCKRSADGTPDTRSADLAAYAREVFGEGNIHVRCINSVETKTRASKSPPFGRDEILRDIERLLWTDVCSKMAGEYARDLRSGMYRIYHQVCWGIESGVGRICRSSYADVFSGNLKALKEDLDAIDARRKENVAAVLGELTEEYGRRMEQLQAFCRQYGIGPPGDLPQLEPAGCLAVEDTFAIGKDELAETTVGRFLSDLTDVDRDNLWALFGGLMKGIGGLLTYRQIFRSTVRDLKRILRRRLPDMEEIRSRISAVLTEGQAHCLRWESQQEGETPAVSEPQEAASRVCYE